MNSIYIFVCSHAKLTRFRYTNSNFYYFMPVPWQAINISRKCSYQMMRLACVLVSMSIWKTTIYSSDDCSVEHAPYEPVEIRERWVFCLRFEVLLWMNVYRSFQFLKQSNKRHDSVAWCCWAKIFALFHNMIADAIVARYSLIYLTLSFVNSNSVLEEYACLFQVSSEFAWCLSHTFGWYTHLPYTPYRR